MDRILLSAPDVRDLEREYVNAAIDSNWIAPAGPDLERFEVLLAERTGRRHAVALSSGTAALHLALLAAGVEHGDEVLVSTLTFIGSVSPICHIGAVPVFIDSDAQSWNMSADLLEAELGRRAQTGSLPAAVVAVDLYGNPADYRRITAACANYGVSLVEDAAEALGATHDDGPCGSFGSSAILSFNGNKIATSGGGGALVTDDAAIADRVRYLSTQAREPALHYEHTEIGYNYRMSNILAALGRAQVERLDERIARRREFYDAYAKVSEAAAGVELLSPPPWGAGNYWLSCISLEPGVAKIDAAGLIARLDEASIESRPVWKPMHLQPVFSGAAAVLSGYAEKAFAAGVCLPSGSGMTDDQFAHVMRTFEEAVV